GGPPLTRTMLSQEAISDATAILDAGCGTGRTSAYIAEQYGSRVTALDNHPVMLEKARQRLSQVPIPVMVSQGSMENLPFADASFDYVIAESVLAFTDTARTIPECCRVLKPGGVLLAVDMTLERPLADAEAKPIVDFYGVARLHTEQAWYSLFAAAGFKTIAIDTFDASYAADDADNMPDFFISEDVNVS